MWVSDGKLSTRRLEILDEFPMTASDTTGSEEEIRTGSPFAEPDSQLSAAITLTPVTTAEADFDLIEDGLPIRYTALGAVASATMLVAFAVAAAAWFPGGGVVITLLGCALAIYGFASRRRRIAGVLLATHLGLLVLSYARTLSG